MPYFSIRSPLRNVGTSAHLFTGNNRKPFDVRGVSKRGWRLWAVALPEGSTHNKVYQTQGFGRGSFRYKNPSESSGNFSEPIPIPGCAFTGRATTSWPESCRYFIPEVMDPQTCLALNADDARYLESRDDATQSLEYIDLNGKPPALKRATFTSRDTTELRELLSLGQLTTDGTRIVFVHVRRCFLLPRTTFCKYGVTRETWQHILSSAMIPPNAIELIHDKSGGHWSCNTYCRDNGNEEDTATDDIDACAYHLAVKLCTWLGNEHFVYARHDFHTRRNLILLVGTGRSAEITRLLCLSGSRRPTHLFSTLCAITTTWLNEIASIGMDLDFATQALEAETGYSNRVFRSEPLPPEQLSLRKGIIAVRENLHGACRASTLLRDVFYLLDTELSGDGEYLSGVPEYRKGTKVTRLCLIERQLRRQLQQRATQSASMRAQLQQLVRRVDTQWQITTALISRHNNELTMQMARDSRNESVLMRKIAFVTIVFLPATFMATFFSMSFFHVSGGTFTVSRWIWLYVACTVPLTFVLSVGYGDTLSTCKEWYKRWRLGQWKEAKGDETSPVENQRKRIARTEARATMKSA